MLKNSSYFFLFCLAFSLSSHADNATAQLSQRLQALANFQAQFSQETFSAKGQSLQNLTGNIALRAPTSFYWQTAAPNTQVLVSDGKTVWHYDDDLEQVVIQDYARQLQKAPLLQILQAPDSIAESFKVSLLDKKTESYQLQPLEKQASLHSVQLSFMQGQLQSVEFIDGLQQRTRIVFSKQKNTAADAALFTFLLPDGVDVLYE